MKTTGRGRVLEVAIKTGHGDIMRDAIDSLTDLAELLRRCDDLEDITEAMADARVMLTALGIMLGNNAQVYRIEADTMEGIWLRGLTADSPKVERLAVDLRHPR